MSSDPWNQLTYVVTNNILISPSGSNTRDQNHAKEETQISIVWMVVCDNIDKMKINEEEINDSKND